MIASILKSAILDSAILYKKNFTQSFWLNLLIDLEFYQFEFISAILKTPSDSHVDSIQSHSN